jgi:hypothetical protein
VPKPTSLIRTNIFLSKEEKTELARVGRQKKISAAEVLRQIIDHALGIKHRPVEVGLPVLDLKKLAAEPKWARES